MNTSRHINKHMHTLMQQFPFEGLTFDDISLVTQYADFLPDETDLSVHLTKNIRLNIPFVSAAMDTVTESEMATTMALLGGIGIIHKNLTIKEQTDDVATVKHHLHGLIRDPITFNVNDTLKSVIKRRNEKGFKFSGFPILDNDDNLVGILTSTDIKFSPDCNARVDQVMTRDVQTAPPNTTLQEAYTIMMKHKIGKLPLIENSKLVGLYSFS
ncbi:MAG: IMP dehydrogenase, partial [Lentisphaerae bacterium]|nr:IMP dehydrogenase [Lentisphaerota bacterium]